MTLTEGGDECRTSGEQHTCPLTAKTPTPQFKPKDHLHTHVVQGLRQEQAVRQHLGEVPDQNRSRQSHVDGALRVIHDMLDVQQIELDDESKQQSKDLNQLEVKVERLDHEPHVVPSETAQIQLAIMSELERGRENAKAAFVRMFEDKLERMMFHACEMMHLEQQVQTALRAPEESQTTPENKQKRPCSNSGDRLPSSSHTVTSEAPRFDPISNATVGQRNSLLSQVEGVLDEAIAHVIQYISNLGGQHISATQKSEWKAAVKCGKDVAQQAKHLAREELQLSKPVGKETVREAYHKLEDSTARVLEKQTILDEIAEAREEALAAINDRQRSVQEQIKVEITMATQNALEQLAAKHRDFERSLGCVFDKESGRVRGVANQAENEMWDSKVDAGKAPEKNFDKGETTLRTFSTDIEDHLRTQQAKALGSILKEPADTTAGNKAELIAMANDWTEAMNKQVKVAVDLIRDDNRASIREIEEITSRLRDGLEDRRTSSSAETSPYVLKALAGIEAAGRKLEAKADMLDEAMLAFESRMVTMLDARASPVTSTSPQTQACLREPSPSRILDTTSLVNLPRHTLDANQIAFPLCQVETCAEPHSRGLIPHQHDKNPSTPEPTASDLSVYQRTWPSYWPMYWEGGDPTGLGRESGVPREDGKGKENTAKREELPGFGFPAWGV